MKREEILDRMSKTGAIITESHVVYTSGRHGSAYVNKDAIYPHTGDTSALCEAIANHFHRYQPEVVVAPAIGGVILSQWTANWLTYLNGTWDKEREVLSIYAEKDTGAGLRDTFVIKRGYDKLISGKRILVVEDVLTTGGSVKKVIEAVRQLGGEVIGVGALCNRGKVLPSDIGTPELFALIDVEMDSWPEEECPLCSQGVPINTDVGKGREFLLKKKN